MAGTRRSTGAASAGCTSWFPRRGRPRSVVRQGESPKLGVGLAQHVQQLGSQLVTCPLGGRAYRLGQVNELVSRLASFGGSVDRVPQLVHEQLESVAQAAGHGIALLPLPDAAQHVAKRLAQRLEFVPHVLPGRIAGRSTREFLEELCEIVVVHGVLALVSHTRAPRDTVSCPYERGAAGQGATWTADVYPPFAHREGHAGHVARGWGAGLRGCGVRRVWRDTGARAARNPGRAGAAGPG